MLNEVRSGCGVGGCLMEARDVCVGEVWPTLGKCHSTMRHLTILIHHPLAIVHMYVPLVVWMYSTCVSSHESDCFVKIC